MMGMRGSPSADKAGLACHKAEVILAAYPPRLGEREDAFVDPLPIRASPIASEGSTLMLLACSFHEGHPEAFVALIAPNLAELTLSRG